MYEGGSNKTTRVSTKTSKTKGLLELKPLITGSAPQVPIGTLAFFAGLQVNNPATTHPHATNPAARLPVTGGNLRLK